MKENTIYKLSKKFALRIIKLFEYLRNEKGEYVISKQIYRSGTSIGANVAESPFAQSDAETLVLIRLLSAKAVVHMDSLHVNLLIADSRKKHHQQGNAVSSAGKAQQVASVFYRCKFSAK